MSKKEYQVDRILDDWFGQAVGDHEDAAALEKRVYGPLRALEAECERLKGAFHQIESCAIAHLDFEIVEEGGLDAATKNICLAIWKARSGI